MSIVSLILTSLQPVLKVGLLCGAGAICAQQGLLTNEGRRVMSGLVFNLLVPCLFLDKLGSGPAGFEGLFTLWPLTFNMLATHIIGGILGLLLVSLIRVPTHLRNHIILATMVGNTGNLPMVLVGSLGSDPALAWLGGAATGIQYIILANLTAAFFQFPFTIMLLRKSAEEQQQEQQLAAGIAAGSGLDKAALAAKKGVPSSLTVTISNPAGKEVTFDEEGEDSAAARPLLLYGNLSTANSHPASPFSSRGNGLVSVQSGSSYAGSTTPGSYQNPQVVLQSPKQVASELISLPSHKSRLAQMTDASAATKQLQPSQSVALLVADAPASPLSSAAGVGYSSSMPASKQQGAGSPTAAAVVAVAGGGTAAAAVVAKRGAWWDGVGAALASWWEAAKPMVTGVITPPTMACVVALTIASFPTVQGAFFAPQGALRLVGDVVRMFSDMAIPALMLVLGANLGKGPGVADLPPRVILATLVCRLLLLPLVGTAMVMAMKSMGLLHNMQPIGIISMLVTHAVPTAIIVHSMATMFQNKQDEVAALLFWEYTACAVTLPPMLALFLHLAM